jgi:hypothetical protein
MLRCTPTLPGSEEKRRLSLTRCDTSLIVLALAAIAFIIAVARIGQCSVSIDAANPACGRDGMPTVNLAAPLILLPGGIVAFVQT